MSRHASPFSELGGSLRLVAFAEFSRIDSAFMLESLKFPEHQIKQDITDL